MSRTWIALSWLLAVTAAANAQPWTPSPCGREFEKGWAAHARAMREAKPGSMLYVPRPYPTTKAEIIEDFEHFFRYPDRPLDRVAPFKRPVVAGVRRGTLVYEVDRVENWSPARCQKDRPRDYDFVLRIRETPGGPLIARASVSQDGFWGAATFRPAEDRVRVYWDRAVPPLDRVVAEVKEIFGIAAHRLQYVTVWGRPDCSVQTPCVAFQASGRSYVYDAAYRDLFEFGPSSPQHPNAVAWRRHGGTQVSLEPGETLMSVGHDRWVVAREVPRAVPD